MIDTCGKKTQIMLAGRGTQPSPTQMDCCLVTKSCITLCDPHGACRAPLSMKFSRQEYWSGLPFPSPGDLSDPGIELASPTL